MACSECKTAADNPHWSRFDPACLWCGARLIQRIDTFRARPVAELATRKRRVLADWMALGHSEADLRRLAKGSTPLEPDGHGVVTESAPPKPAKRR